MMRGKRLSVGVLFCLVMPHIAAFSHSDHRDSLDSFEALHWSWDPLVASLLALSSVLYFVGTLKLWRQSYKGGGIRQWQAACFVAGWLIAALALVSPLDPMGEVLFSAHMVQHELLMVVAAPLMVLGRPLAVFVWALPLSLRRGIGHATRSKPVDIFWSFITHPSAAWTIHALVLWVWHAPPFFQASILNSTVHTFQHISFLFAALLFWWALFQTRPRHGGSGVAIIYLLTTAMHTGLLGALLTFSTRLWYPVYAPTAVAWGLTPIEDQQLGGLIMWVPGGLSYLAAGLWLMGRLLQSSDAGPEKQLGTTPAKH
jgi:putative membrane protein